MKTIRKMLPLALALCLLLACCPASAQINPLLVKALAKVVVTPTGMTIYAGDTLQMTATRMPQNEVGTAETILWETTTPKILSVDENGLVTALLAGKGYVRATDRETGKRGTVKVTVKPLKVSKVVLPKSSMAIGIGEVSEALSGAYVVPANAPDAAIAWKSSKPAIATVDEKGVVTGVAAGSTVITATAGGKQATCKVRVMGKSTTFTLSAVGDVILGGDPRTQKKSWLPRKTEDTFDQYIATYGMDYPFKNVIDIFRGDDISIVNLEGTVAGDNAIDTVKPFVFRAKKAYIQMLKDATIDVCNLANNHARDLREEGLAESKKNLKSFGILNCDYTENCAKVLTKDGISVKIGFCGFRTPVTHDYVAQRVKNLKNAGKCDIVVASFHWCTTKEWTSKIYQSDRSYAQCAIRNGADLVLGHHRHRLAGIETYHGKTIVYDLGNFIVGIKHKLDNDTMIFQQTFRVDEKGYVQNESFKVIPATTTTTPDLYGRTDSYGDLGAQINDWQPALVTGERAQGIIARVQAMSNVTIPTTW